MKTNRLIIALSVMALLCSCGKTKYLGDRNLSLTGYYKLDSAIIYDPENSEKYAIENSAIKKILNLLEGAEEVNNKKKLYSCLQVIADDSSHSDGLFIVVFKNNVFSVNGDYYEKKELSVLSEVHSILDDYRKSNDVKFLPIE